jgi:putative membrane protein
MKRSAPGAHMETDSSTLESAHNSSSTNGMSANGSSTKESAPSFSQSGARWLLAGAVFLFINGFFVAKVEQATRPELANVSVFFVLVLWAPAFWALKKWLGWKRAALIAVSLAAFALFIETVAIQTGLPYGRFSYGEKIGEKIGVVPWTVGFSWSPLVLGALALGARHVRSIGKLVLVSTGFLLLFDGVLDPGAVQQEFWKFEAGGLYYGVPFSNFCGWVVSGLIGTAIFTFAAGKRTDVPLALVSSAVLILAFWTSVCLFVGLWIPAVLGAALLCWCARQVRRDLKSRINVV